MGRTASGLSPGGADGLREPRLICILIWSLTGFIVQLVMTSPLHGEDPGFESLWTHSFIRY